MKSTAGKYTSSLKIPKGSTLAVIVLGIIIYFSGIISEFFTVCWFQNDKVTNAAAY